MRLRTIPIPRVSASGSQRTVSRQASVVAFGRGLSRPTSSQAPRMRTSCNGTFDLAAAISDAIAGSAGAGRRVSGSGAFGPPPVQRMSASGAMRSRFSMNGRAVDSGAAGHPPPPPRVSIGGQLAAEIFSAIAEHGEGNAEVGAEGDAEGNPEEEGASRGGGGGGHAGGGSGVHPDSSGDHRDGDGKRAAVVRRGGSGGEPHMQRSGLANGTREPRGQGSSVFERLARGRPSGAQHSKKMRDANAARHGASAAQAAALARFQHMAEVRPCVVSSSPCLWEVKAARWCAVFSSPRLF
eukprot:364169-Chlamydomonas_euryale.AAC.12